MCPSSSRSLSTVSSKICLSRANIEFFTASLSSSSSLYSSSSSSSRSSSPAALLVSNTNLAIFNKIHSLLCACVSLFVNFSYAFCNLLFSVSVHIVLNRASRSMFSKTKENQRFVFRDDFGDELVGVAAVAAVAEVAADPDALIFPATTIKLLSMLLFSLLLFSDKEVV